MVFKACKHAIDKKGYRPMYGRIRLECKGGMCRASALDGYRMRCITVPCSGDEGILCVPLVNIPKAPMVTIEEKGEEIIFDFQYEKQVVKKINGESSNPDSFIPKEDPEFTISFNPKYMKEAFESFQGDAATLSFYGQNRPCVIWDKQNNVGMVLPLLMR